MYLRVLLVLRMVSYPLADYAKGLWKRLGLIVCDTLVPRPATSPWDHLHHLHLLQGRHDDLFIPVGTWKGSDFWAEGATALTKCFGDR